MPASTASPHQSKVAKYREPFNKLVKNETEKGWFKTPFQMPSTLPFRVSPGNIEPKSTPGKYRLLWNLSWPAKVTTASTSTCGKETCSVATNFYTKLPEFAEFEWPEINTNREVIFVLAELEKRTQETLLSWLLDFQTGSGS